MVRDTLLVAGGLIFVGGLLSIYHLTKIYPTMGKTSLSRFHVAMAVLGGFMVSIGSNLFADALHDGLTS
jgi:hypothetical protein